MASAVGSVAGAVIGGHFSNKAAGKAAEGTEAAAAAQERMLDQQLEFLREGRDQSRAFLEPFRQGGLGALDAYRQLVLGDTAEGGGAALTPDQIQQQTDLQTRIRDERGSLQELQQRAADTTSVEGFINQSGGLRGAAQQLGIQVGRLDSEVNRRRARERIQSALSGRGNQFQADILEQQNVLSGLESELQGITPSGTAGGGGGGQPLSLEDMPAFQFLQRQGQRAVESSGAARGMQLSGRTLGDLQERGSDIASTFRGQILGEIGQLMNVGQSAAAGQASTAFAGGQSMAGAAGQAGANLSNLAVQQGNIGAAGALGQGQALATGLTGILSNPSLFGGGTDLTADPFPGQPGR